MKLIRDRRVQGSDGRLMPVDIHAPGQEGGQKPPLVLFAHGFKGFKDFGAWDLVAPNFAEAGFVFVKFNFSHNGGTVEQPIDFPDLEAFGRNTYSKELFDLDCMLHALTSGSLVEDLPVDTRRIHLIGHSVGGGICALQAAADERVKKLATWASVSDFHQRVPSLEEAEQWKKAGITYISNARTGQQMPLYYSFYQDLMENSDKLSIPKAAPNIDIPWLICHGTEDPTVELKEAKALAKWNPKADSFFVEGADHAFGQKHPWEKDELPEALQKVTDRTIEHFKSP